MDGVGMYHMHIPELSEEERTLMTDAVRAAGKRDYDLADKLFNLLGRQKQALFVIDDLQQYIIRNQNEFDGRALFDYGRHLLFEADDRECVKFGLALLELFKTDRMDDIRNAVRTIGLSDEFALFAIFVMLKWPDGNDEVWHPGSRSTAFWSTFSVKAF